MTIQNRLAFMASVAALLVAAPAIAADVTGSTSATFVNPGPVGTVTTGVGTNVFTYGMGSPPNELTFTGSTFSSPIETPFKVGSLYYYNGSTTVGTTPDSVDLSLSLNFTSPALPTVVSTFALNLVSTPNSGTADQNADYVYFPSSFSSTSFLIGTTTYNIKLTGFGNIVGDGFLSSNSAELHVRENSSATADLFAIVTTQTAAGAVPEPATWLMMIVGMGAIGFVARRRSNVRVAYT